MAYPELAAMYRGIFEGINKLKRYEPKLEEVCDLKIAGATEKLLSEIESQVKSADEKFTIAVVGEFKTGKSTFINGMLSLSGDNRLSAEDRPDTACPTIIKHADSAGGCEARVKYSDHYEEVTWAEAKDLTSRVAWDKDPSIQHKAQKMIEIEYFVANDLLNSINIIDLPGTGTIHIDDDTAIARHKMREADLVLWLVNSEEEPTQTAHEDLKILSEISSAVIPIINVVEDPTLDPPLGRDNDSVREISEAITTQYSQFFAKDIKRPFEVSARVVELEMVKKNPSKEILQAAGFTLFFDFLTDRFLNRQESLRSGKFNRLCGNMGDIAERGQIIIEQVNSACLSTRNGIKNDEQDLFELSEKIEDARFNHRIQIRPLARSLSNKIINHVSALTKIFIEDTLTLANVPDLSKSMSKNGKDSLGEELSEKFVEKYLDLKNEPNWLTGMRDAFSQDVFELLYPSWQRIQRSIVDELMYDGPDDEDPDPDIDDLPKKLQQAVIDVIERIIAIGAVAALLVYIPGGAVVDAIGIVGLIILSVFHDPLEKPRLNAIKRTRFQLEAQESIMTGNLLKAGMRGNKVFEDQIMDGIHIKKKSMKDMIDFLSAVSQTTTDSASAIEEIVEKLNSFD